MQVQRLTGIVLLIVSILLFVVLILVKSGIDIRDTQLCTFYATNNLNMAECPAHTTGTSWWVVVAFICDIALFITAIVLLIMPLRTRGSLQENASPRKEINISSLSEDERKAYECVRNHQGPLYQSTLMKELEWSKVKVTRVLDKLEQGGLVERKRRGMTNLVVLK